MRAVAARVVAVRAVGEMAAAGWAVAVREVAATEAGVTVAAGLVAAARVEVAWVAAAMAEVVRAAAATVVAQAEGCYAPRCRRLSRIPPAGGPTAIAAHFFVLLPRAQDRGLHPFCLALLGRVDRFPLAHAC